MTRKSAKTGAEEVPFLLKSVAGVTWLEDSRLSGFPWIVHAFSTRWLAGKPHRAAPTGLEAGARGASQAVVTRANHRPLFRQLAVQHFAAASLKQVHSAEIWQVQHGATGKLEYLPAGYLLPPGASRPEHAGDALLTNEPGILLTVRAADCLPVVIADPKRRVIACVHAGWRGLLKRIVEKSVGEMRRIYGCEPRDLLAALGPSIRSCCYEVGPE
ncbi:MAG: laccase domain-containing protein, partial [Terriglobia bacterium]